MSEERTERQSSSGSSRESRSGSRPPYRRQRRGNRRGRRRGASTVCGPQCVGFKKATIDYKQLDIIKRFVTDRGKIRPRRQTGNCAKHQRTLARAIKRARHIALLPYTADHVFSSERRD